MHGALYEIRPGGLEVSIDAERIKKLKQLKAGVACLKAQGYRSAELYMSAALLRHRAKYGQEWDVSIAAQEAVRLAKRGRGPPTGKQPVPVPRAGSFLFEALVTGIWDLLRVSELLALNIEDVFQKRVAGRIQVAVMVRSSKTDQEYNGEYVTRECTCTANPNDSCPAHILWDQVAER